MVDKRIKPRGMSAKAYLVMVWQACQETTKPSDYRISYH